MNKKFIYIILAVIFLVGISMVTFRPAEAISRVGTEMIICGTGNDDMAEGCQGGAAFTCPNTYTGACTVSKCSEDLGSSNSHACEWKCVGGTYQSGSECSYNMCYGAGCA